MSSSSARCVLLGFVTALAGAPAAQSVGVWMDRLGQAGSPRQAAIRALIEIGPDAVPWLLDELVNHVGSDPGPGGSPLAEPPIHDGPLRVPRDLLPSTKWLGWDPCNTVFWVRDAHALKSRAVGRCMASAWVLGEIGDARAVAGLTAAFGGGLPLQCQAIDALGKICHPEAAAALAGALDLPRSGRWAAEALAGLGEVAVPALARALRAEDRGARFYALLAAGSMASDGTAVLVGALLDSLASKDIEEVALAARALVARGKVAVPSLMQVMFASDIRQRRHAAAVLALIGPEAAPAAFVLLDQLGAGDDLLVRWSVTALGALELQGAIATTTAQALVALCQAGGPARVTAVESLARLAAGARGEGAALALAALDHATASDDVEVRGRAITVLGTLHARPEIAVTTLRAVLRSGDDAARCSAAVGLGRLQGEAAAAVPELTAALQSGSSKLRARAARALGKIGAGADEALPALRAARGDPVPTVAMHAKVAVQHIEALVTFR